MGAKLVRINTAQIIDSVISNDTKTVLKRYKNLTTNQCHQDLESGHVAHDIQFKQAVSGGIIIFYTLLAAFLLFTTCVGIFYLSVEKGQKIHNTNHATGSNSYMAHTQETDNLLRDMDLENGDPCDDFYEYSCGNWAKNHRRPDTNIINWHNEVSINITHAVRDFLNSTATIKEPKIVNQSRIMYHSCMKSDDIIENEGKKTILEYLKLFQLPKLPTIFDKVNDSTIPTGKFNWIKTVAEIKRTFDINVILGFDIITNPIDRTKKGIKLGIPNTDKSLSQNTSNAPTSSDDSECESLEECLSHFLKLLNPDFVGNVTSHVKNYWNMDKFFTTKRVRNNSVQQWENIDEFNQNMGQTNLAWHQYLETVFKNSSVNFSNQLIFASSDDLEYLKSVIEHISTKSEEELELYIWWKVMDEVLAPYVEPNSENELQKSIYCASYVENFMPMIATYGILTPDFETVTKPKVSEMVENIQSVFHEMIEQAEWVDQTTKTMIIEKSKAMKVDIGYPEWLLNEDKLQEYYGALNLNETTFLKNIISTLQNEMNIKLKSLNSTEDMGWELKPLTVNANHNRARNAITIPIAILQYPFYNLGMEALNYGAIGAILGHELMHGFDEGGRQFDKNGKFVENIWTTTTIDKYKDRQQCLIEQYGSSITSEKNSYAYGEKTLDENISDNIGLQLAFNAYKKHLAKHEMGKAQPLLDKFTHDQLFFISYGNRWCQSGTEDIMEHIFQNNRHSLNKLRVNNVVANSNEFKEVFKCSAESKMVSKKPCSIW